MHALAPVAPGIAAWYISVSQESVAYISGPSICGNVSQPWCCALAVPVIQAVVIHAPVIWIVAVIVEPGIIVVVSVEKVVVVSVVPEVIGIERHSCKRICPWNN